jgi:deazaflavin-dependent oxidoreductase (nitroreductase family)
LTVVAAMALLVALFLVVVLLVRFQKRRLAAFHRAFTNRITRRFAARVPGFGIITHVGRRSGKVYRTPVNVFRTSEGFLIALTYGRESDWVKNVIAAGGCQLETRGVRYHISTPTVVHDPNRRRFPLLVRTILQLIGANDFMQAFNASLAGRCTLARRYTDEKRERILAAKLLMVVSASIAFTLGAFHLVYTFWGSMLTPRDPALQISMSQISPVITEETTMWRCWVGFNASHSMGLILFGLVFGFLALAHDELLFRSPFLLVVGLALLAGFVVLCKVYFFSAPLTGISISLACYVTSIALSRA